MLNALLFPIAVFCIFLILVIFKLIFKILGSTSYSSPENYISHNSWSIELLKQLEWKRFEEVAAEYYCLRGYKAETTRIGADGGIDIKIYEKETNKPVGIVQCKAWNSQKVGIKPIRELLGVMTHENVKLGIFMTSGGFTGEAKSFANKHNLVLVDGYQFLQEINKLGQDKSESLLQTATYGDFTTPTCPRCDVKMILKTRRKDGGEFWGCPNYKPYGRGCAQTFNIRTRY